MINYNIHKIIFFQVFSCSLHCFIGLPKYIFPLWNDNKWNFVHKKKIKNGVDPLLHRPTQVLSFEILHFKNLDFQFRDQNFGKFGMFENLRFFNLGIWGF